MANKYSVLLELLVNSNSHLVFEFEGKIKFITVTQYQNVSEASMILKFTKKDLYDQAVEAHLEDGKKDTTVTSIVIWNQFYKTFYGRNLRVCQSS